MHRHLKRTFKIILTVFFVLIVGFLIWFMSGEGVKPQKITWGVTFSPRQTEYLGLNSGEVFQALLDDMKVRNFRLMAPWYQIEPKEGQFDFSSVDWYLNEAAKRDAKVILALGRKLFRWPECHEPLWTKSFSTDEFESKLLAALEQEIRHFKKFSNITGWQIENEVLLPFGECSPRPNLELFKKEIALVRSLDNRPIISTESGELSAWIQISSLVDRLGVSLYRVTNNPVLGKIYYPFRPGFYQKKAVFAKVLNPGLQDVFISELQLEPWGDKPLRELTLAEQYDRMSLERTKSIIDYASRTGLSEIYLWGAEWWYWLKEVHKDARFWEIGKELLSNK